MTDAHALILEHETKDVSEGGKQNHFEFWGRVTFSLLTEAEVAAVVNVTPLTLSKWRREGKGPDYVRPGKTVFYRREDVEDWLKMIRTVPGTPVADGTEAA
jgi:hypothetical protein